MDILPLNIVSFKYWYMVTCRVKYMGKYVYAEMYFNNVVEKYCDVVICFKQYCFAVTACFFWMENSDAIFSMITISKIHIIYVFKMVTTMLHRILDSLQMLLYTSISSTLALCAKQLKKGYQTDLLKPQPHLVSNVSVLHLLAISSH